MIGPGAMVPSRDVLQAGAVLLALPALSSLGNLVKVTLASILQVVLLCTAGYVLARRGILDKKTQGNLNKLNVSLLTPALLFSKVAFSLTPERMSELAVVPLGFVIVSLVSALAAYLVSWAMGISKGQRYFVIACAITPNSNTLPVALIQSLVVSMPELRWERAGAGEDTPDDMMGRALTYLILFSTLGTVQRWSFSAKLLSKVRSDEPGPPPPSHYRDDVTDNLVDARHRQQLAEGHVPAFPTPSHEDVETGTADNGPVPYPPTTPRWRVYWQTYVVSGWHGFLAFMTIPLWAALASVIVAMVPPLQKFVLSLTPLVGVMYQAGGCSIPLTILVLGAYFAGSIDTTRTPPHATPAEAAHAQAGLDKSWRTIVAATTARMIVTPLLLLPALTYLCLYSRSYVVDDPVFIACTCLVIGSPPALTLAQITTQRGDPNSNIEYLISGTIFVSYVFVTAPTTVALVMTALVIDEVQNNMLAFPVIPTGVLSAIGQ